MQLTVRWCSTGHLKDFWLCAVILNIGLLPKSEGTGLGDFTEDNCSSRWIVKIWSTKTLCLKMHENKRHYENNGIKEVFYVNVGGSRLNSHWS